MRLLILGLLAWSAHAHSISYRNNLLSYAPARGEFPVHSDLARGYLSYVDNTGAERLLGFNYPEPLYGIRSSQIESKLEAHQLHLTQFRAWCEQRYNALKIELERLRAEGKKPSPSILAQIEPLEKLIKTNPYEVAGLSPEVQRAHDEHLRIWNESRLQVLQAELAQGGLPQSVNQRISDEAVQLMTSPIQLQSPPLPQSPPLSQPSRLPQSPQLPQLQSPPQPQLQSPPQPAMLKLHNHKKPPLYESLEAPQPVQETEEVRRAREEHLRRYNEALQAQLKTPAAILEVSIQPQQSPQPVEETPEVKLAREQHLKQYNDEVLRQTAEAPQQPIASLAPLPTAAPNTKNLPSAPLPMAIKQTQPQPTLPEVTIKSSIPIPIPVPVPQKQNIHEQKIQLLNQSKIKAEDDVADIADRIKLEERERERELLREKELRREEQKQAELEREREQLRILEEQKLIEAERIYLQQQEQQRIESERQQETKRIQAIFTPTEGTPALPTSNYKLIAPTPVQPQTPTQSQSQPQAISQQQQVQNSFFLRIQAGQPTETAPEGMVQNPFLIRYLQQPPLQSKPLVQPQQELKAVQALQPQQLLFPQQILLPQPAPLPQMKVTPIIAPTSIPNPALIPMGLTELEIANREHFRAHEIALEQLRLANLRNPEAVPTACQH